MKCIRDKTPYCQDIVIIEVTLEFPILLSLVYGTVYKAEKWNSSYVCNDNISNHLEMKKNSIFHLKIFWVEITKALQNQHFLQSPRVMPTLNSECTFNQIFSGSKLSPLQWNQSCHKDWHNHTVFPLPESQTKILNPRSWTWLFRRAFYWTEQYN